ncbi:zinc ribbon domain-containing protein [Luteibacter sp. E-22]|uniref:zinc ribbon domain-containing protein n=1 Tax=Luteibacter sp. E-22 TaxID=3404050 RepID=UPI003CEC877A
MEDANGQPSSRLSEIERVVEQLVERVNAIAQAYATEAARSVSTNWIPIPWIPVTPGPPPPPPPPPTSAPTPPPGPLPTPRPPATARYCPACGTVVQAGWVYCGYCGTKL